MGVYRIIFICSLVTAMAVGYVHQRVEIVKAGYGLQKNKKYLSQLIDQNSKLMYNLSKLESPRSLLTSLNTQKIEFAAHRSEHSDRDMLLCAGSKDENAAEGLMGFFLDVFTAKAEAKSRR